MRVVAIDGPVGAGKSTVARAVGERLGLPVLETGAMYRAVAAVALRRGIEPGPDTADTIVAVAGELPPEAVDDPDGLRTPDVNRVVSAVAAISGVRTVLVDRQRAWAEKHGGGVIEGRDIGTVVFPDAAVKVFLTASEAERARRRGPDEDAATVAQRDRIDSTRAVSPLLPAPDALVIDTTGRPIDEIVDEIVSRW